MKMNPTIFLSICSMFYCVLLLVKQITLKEEKTAKTSILKCMTVVNLLTLLCEISGIFLGINYEKYPILNSVVLRAMLIFYCLWLTFFVMYIINISLNEKKIKFKDNWYMFILMMIASVLLIVLQINYVTKNGVVMYSTGMAVNVLLYYSMGCKVLALLIMFKNVKKTKIKNYSSLFVLIALSALSVSIQSQNPSMLLSASMDTFVTFYIYLNNHTKAKEVKKND